MDSHSSVQIDETLSPLSNMKLLSPIEPCYRSPLRDTTNYVATPDASGGKKSDQSGQQVPADNRDFSEENGFSSQQSTPKKNQDCDTESDTTAEYESAGEASPWDKRSNVSVLADYLAGVHLSTPDKIHAKLNSFPFSPISAEDDCDDDEITAIISNRSISSSHTLSFHDKEDLSLSKNEITIPDLGNTSFNNLDEFENSAPCKRHSETNIDSVILHHSEDVQFGETIDSLSDETTSFDKVQLHFGTECSNHGEVNKLEKLSTSYESVGEKLTTSQADISLNLSNSTNRELLSSTENISQSSSENKSSVCEISGGASSQMVSQKHLNTTSKINASSNFSETSRMNDYVSTTKHKIDTILNSQKEIVSNVISETKHQIDNMFKFKSPTKEESSKTVCTVIEGIIEPVSKTESDLSAQCGKEESERKQASISTTKQKIDSLFTIISPKKEISSSETSDVTSLSGISLVGDHSENKSLTNENNLPFVESCSQKTVIEKQENVFSELVPSKSVVDSSKIVNTAKQQIDKIFKLSPLKVSDDSRISNISTVIKHEDATCDLNISTHEIDTQLVTTEIVSSPKVNNLSILSENNSEQETAAVEEKLDKLKITDSPKEIVINKLSSPSKLPENNEILNETQSGVNSVSNSADVSLQKSLLEDAERLVEKEKLSHNSLQISSTTEKEITAVPIVADQMDVGNIQLEVESSHAQNATVADKNVSITELITEIVVNNAEVCQNPPQTSSKLQENNEILNETQIEVNSVSNSIDISLQKPLLEDAERLVEKDKLSHNSLQISSTTEKEITAVPIVADQMDVGNIQLEVESSHAQNATVADKNVSITELITEIVVNNAEVCQNPPQTSSKLQENNEILNETQIEVNSVSNSIDISLQKSLLEDAERLVEKEKLSHNSLQISSTTEKEITAVPTVADQMDVGNIQLEVESSHAQNATVADKNVSITELITEIVVNNAEVCQNPPQTSSKLQENNEILNETQIEVNSVSNSIDISLQKPLLEDAERLVEKDKLSHNSLQISSTTEKEITAVPIVADQMDVGNIQLEVESSHAQNATVADKNVSITELITEIVVNNAEVCQNSPQTSSKLQENNEILNETQIEVNSVSNSADISLQKSLLEDAERLVEKEKLSHNSLQISSTNEKEITAVPIVADQMDVGNIQLEVESSHAQNATLADKNVSITELITEIVVNNAEVCQNSPQTSSLKTHCEEASIRISKNEMITEQVSKNTFKDEEEKTSASLYPVNQIKMKPEKENASISQDISEPSIEISEEELTVNTINEVQTGLQIKSLSKESFEIISDGVDENDFDKKQEVGITNISEKKTDDIVLVDKVYLDNTSIQNITSDQINMHLQSIEEKDTHLQNDGELNFSFSKSDTTIADVIDGRQEKMVDNSELIYPLKIQKEVVNIVSDLVDQVEITQNLQEVQDTVSMNHEVTHECIKNETEHIINISKSDITVDLVTETTTVVSHENLNNSAEISPLNIQNVSGIVDKIDATKSEVRETQNIEIKGSIMSAAVKQSDAPQEIRGEISESSIYLNSTNAMDSFDIQNSNEVLSSEISTFTSSKEDSDLNTDFHSTDISDVKVEDYFIQSEATLNANAFVNTSTSETSNRMMNLSLSSILKSPEKDTILDVTSDKVEPTVDLKQVKFVAEGADCTSVKLQEIHLTPESVSNKQTSEAPREDMLTSGKNSQMVVTETTEVKEQSHVNATLCSNLKESELIMDIVNERKTHLTENYSPEKSTFLVDKSFCAASLSEKNNSYLNDQIKSFKTDAKSQSDSSHKIYQDLKEQMNKMVTVQEDGSFSTNGNDVKHSSGISLTESRIPEHKCFKITDVTKSTHVPPKPSTGEEIHLLDRSKDISVKAPDVVKSPALTCPRSSDSIPITPPVERSVTPIDSIRRVTHELPKNSPSDFMKFNNSIDGNVSMVSDYITDLSSAEIGMKSINTNLYKSADHVKKDILSKHSNESSSQQPTLHVQGEMTTRNEKFSYNFNKSAKDIRSSAVNKSSEELKYCGLSDSFKTFKLDDLSKSTIERKSYEDLLDRCLEQERLLGFDESIKEEADKLIKELANASSDSDGPSQPNEFPPGIDNNSEAGPVTADEDLNKADFFQDATLFDFDYLSKIGKGKPGRRLVRESLFLKFDPLASAAAASATPEPTEMAQADSSSDVISTPPRAPLRNGDDKLVSVTPNDEAVCLPVTSSVGTPPRGRPRPTSGSATPTLRHEILSKEIYKLQDLMLRQECSYQEQIAACAEEVEQLREKVAELEARENQENLQDKLTETETEAVRLRKELAEVLDNKKQLMMIMEEYEKTISQVVTMREDDKKKFEVEKEQIGNERDEAVQHLRNMEIAFNDVHQKYEKCKEVIEAFKHNEEQYKISLNENKKTILQQEEKYYKLKEHAAQKLEQANIEISEMKKAHQAELAKMVAVQRKMEIRLKSLEESLEQKKREAAELTKICDDLITKVEQ